MRRPSAGPILHAMAVDAVGSPRRPVRSLAVLRLASDQRLIEHVHAGSQQAFEVLFDRHHRALLAFCRQMLGSREEAEDAVQQTFLAAYCEFERAARPRELRPWLYGIARHRCLSTLRARREHAVEEVPAAAADQLATEVVAREELRAVLADVTRLPEDQRAALVLAELGDTSHAEIADILGCPTEKVKALVFQARSALSAGRAARDTPCAEIQEQLATLHGGALRRTVLRRHLRDCAGCRAFRDTVRAQRRQLVLLLPVAPAAWLKRAVVGALFGSGGAGAGGAAVSTCAIGGAGLAVTALLGVTIPLGTSAPAATRDSREANRARAPAGPTFRRAVQSPAAAAPDSARLAGATQNQVRSSVADSSARPRRTTSTRRTGSRRRPTRSRRAEGAVPPAPHSGTTPSKPSIHTSPAPAERPHRVTTGGPKAPRADRRHLPRPASRAARPGTPPTAPRAHRRAGRPTPPQAHRPTTPPNPPQAGRPAPPARSDDRPPTPPATGHLTPSPPAQGTGPTPGEADRSDAPGRQGRHEGEHTDD